MVYKRQVIAQMATHTERLRSLAAISPLMQRRDRHPKKRRRVVNRPETVTRRRRHLRHSFEPLHGLGSLALPRLARSVLLLPDGCTQAGSQVRGRLVGGLVLSPPAAASITEATSTPM